MGEQQNRESSVIVSINLPNKARETTLLPSNEQFCGGIRGIGDTEVLAVVGISKLE